MSRRAAVVFGCALMTTASCAADVTHVGGAAAPVYSGAPTPSAPSPGGALVLGPDGLGPLKLGMTREQATATGLITAWRDNDNPDCTERAQLRAGGAENLAYYGPDLGVQVIAAYPGLRTPEGIQVGSPTAAMRRAYPDWENVADLNPDAEGRGFAAVPGNPEAQYRIETIENQVYSITLQYTDQTCYE